VADNVWCKATVIEVVQNRAHVRFTGWPSNWDDYISVKSPRLEVYKAVTEDYDTRKGGKKVCW
jgi:hypothetical protein